VSDRGGELEKSGEYESDGRRNERAQAGDHYRLKAISGTVLKRAEHVSVDNFRADCDTEVSA
jgi:hypothetical protein